MFSSHGGHLTNAMYRHGKTLLSNYYTMMKLPDWHLFITGMETKWTKWYAMTLHVIAYRTFELLFGTHTFHFNCFFEDFNCVFTQIRWLSRVLPLDTTKWGPDRLENHKLYGFLYGINPPGTSESDSFL